MGKRQLRKCKWHGCRREFVPAHGSQEYCCPAHRTKMLEWKKARGARMVTLLLETPLSELDRTMRRERAALLKEVGDGS